MINRMTDSKYSTKCLVKPESPMNSQRPFMSYVSEMAQYL